MNTLFLLIGASVTAITFPWQPPSPGHLLASHMGAPVAVYAHAGARLHEVMPPDDAIRDAAMVVAVDSFYWYGNQPEDCAEAYAAAGRLFAARDGRPMLLATVPGEHCINVLLRERCKDACILIEPEPFLGLHPNRAYMDRFIKSVKGTPHE